MPDTLANPYGATSPLGAALKNLSGALVKAGGHEASDIAHLETALALKQKRENSAALGDVLRNLGTAQFDRRAAIDNAVRAGVSPEVVGGFERYNSANQYGAADPRTTNAFVGAGGSYSGTAAGERENIAAANTRNAAQIAEQARQFDAKPTTVNTPQGPVIVRQSESYGQPAVEDIGKVKGAVARNAYASPGGLAGADETTRQFIGAESKNIPTPHNYVTSNGQNAITYDGLTDARTGQPLPPGGYMANAVGPADAVGLPTPVRNNLVQQDLANQKFKGLLNYTRELAKKDPTNFGVTGYVKGAVQDVNATAGNIAHGLGYKSLEDGVNDLRQKMLAQGINPSVLSGVFDPNLPKLHTAANLALYSAAEALAGQSGHSLSDKDIARVKQIVGDPSEWSQTQQKFLSKLDALDEVLNLNQQFVDQNLRRGSPAAPPAAPGAAPPPTPTAPGAQPAAPAPQPAASAPVVKWGRDANGLPVPVQ